MKTQVCIIFQEPTGLYHVSPHDQGYLDARGHGRKTKAEAMRSAWRSGYTHAVGSGTTWDGVRKIPTRYRE
jgi:hypothetical protein